MIRQILALLAATGALGFSYASGSGVLMVVNIVVWFAIFLLIAGGISDEPDLSRRRSEEVR